MSDMNLADVMCKHPPKKVTVIKTDKDTTVMCKQCYTVLARGYIETPDKPIQAGGKRCYICSLYVDPTMRAKTVLSSCICINCIEEWNNYNWLKKAGVYIKAI